MKLLGTNILVKQDAPEEKTASGIYLSTKAPEKPNTGTVIIVGPGLAEEPMTIKPGQYIKYRQGAGMETQHNGETHLIMFQSDVYAILN